MRSWHYKVAGTHRKQIQIQVRDEQVGRPQRIGHSVELVSAVDGEPVKDFLDADVFNEECIYEFMVPSRIELAII